MKKILVTAILILTMLTATLLSGCGQQSSATLEDLAASDSNIEQTINKEIIKPEGMNVEVIFSGDSFDIVYAFVDKRDDSDEKILVKAFDSNSDELKKIWEKAISDLESQTEITGIVGTIIIKNASGDEIWTRIYPEE